MSVLLHAEVDGDRLNQMQIAVFFMLLQNAGSETTRNLITTGMLTLLERPDDLGPPARRPVDPARRHRGAPAPARRR